MPTIKNPLISTFLTDKKIVALSNDTEDTYRKDAAELYREVLQNRKDILSDDFLQRVYETLEAFNMNAKGAKLVKQSSFIMSLQKQGDTIQSLAKYRLERLKNTDDDLKNTIGTLFDKLKLVDTESPLVTFAKTMHFLLPDLFMPIDRKYTLQFFYRNPPYKDKNYGLHYLTNTREKQKERFFEVFEQFRQFAREHCEVLKRLVDKKSRWSWNIPKVIDNIIIAYVKENTE